MMKVSIGTPLDDSFQPKFYHTRKMPYKRVGEAIGEEFNDWVPWVPVLINAPTGLGKTTFVNDALIKKAISCNRNVLILNNRVGLTLQQKHKIIKILGRTDDKEYTPEGLRKKEDFGQIRIMTYHRLLSFLSDDSNTEWCDNLMYVVMDEAHFFVADSLFNEKCDSFQSLIARKFRNAIRVYLTATPYDSLYSLASIEESNYNRFVDFFSNPLYKYERERYMIHYKFERDYSNYNLNFFTQLEELIPKIEDTSTGKWIIFIDNKLRAEEFINMLSVPSVYLDATRKNSNVWVNLIANERFDTKVLVSTSVLDCGVNINDRQLKNIAIITDSRTSMMQMVGRKRLEEGEKVEVWIGDLSTESIYRRLQRYDGYLDLRAELYKCTQIKSYYSFGTKLWESEDAVVRKLFSSPSPRIYENKNAFVYIQRQAEFLNRILSGESNFRYEVEEWFQKEHPPLINRLDEFYSIHRDKVLAEREQNVLREIILQLCREQGLTEAQLKRASTLQYNALNNRLRDIEMPYSIVNLSDSGWQLKYLSEGKEE